MAKRTHGDRSAPAYDLVGIGLGPANLSTAALAHEQRDIATLFFEAKPTLTWHSGLMLDDARMQTSALKDLVTFADPSSQFGFLNFLHDQGRLHAFMNAEFDAVTRREFLQYLRWVAARLDNVCFGCPVARVRDLGDAFAVDLSSGDSVRTRNVAVGVGQRPWTPACARPYLGQSVIHASDYLHRVDDLPAGRIAIVGGGQSAAEIFLDLTRNRRAKAGSIDWITRRPNLSPLDESPFTNESFTPSYVEHFHRLPDSERRRKVSDQKLASDGISERTLREVRQVLYDVQFLDPAANGVSVAVERELVDLQRRQGRFALTLQNVPSRVRETHACDAVILATGYTTDVPDVLSPVQDTFDWDGEWPALDADYAVRRIAGGSGAIFLHNCAQHSHGIADPNLSLVAWRSARILNRVLGRAAFPISESQACIDWPRFEPNDLEVEQVV
jgi:lysine N6-hydroxylase